MSEFIWLSIPAVPLLSALILIFAQRQWLALLVVAPLPALLLGLFPTAPLDLEMLWPSAQWGLTDTLGRSLLGFTALLWSLAGVYVLGSQAQDPRIRRFALFWLLALTGNLLLVVALDSISFYVGFTLMSLSAYGLVAHAPGREPRQAGRIYLQLAVLGEMLLYAGLILRLDEAGGALSFSTWADTPISPLTATLLLIGLGLKAGFWPLHLWLPQAHPAAPPAASAVLSGAMLKAGLLGLWRFFPEGDTLLMNAAQALLALGFFSAFYGALVGLIQTKAKVVLAYSSISQMGYLLTIVALSWHQPEQVGAWGALLGLYAAHHGLAKGALFLGAGLSAKGRLRRWHWWLLWLPALALAGLPLSSGGAVKTQLKSLMASTDFSAWLMLLSLSSVATTLVIARALWLMKPASTNKEGTGHEGHATSGLAPVSCLVLASACVLLPWIWPELRAALFYSFSWANNWALLWPLLAAGALIAAAHTPALAALLARPNWSRLARSPSRRWSLFIKRRLQPPTAPKKVSLPWNDARRWRPWERRWNRFWQQGSVTTSAWLLCILLLLGWVW